MNREQLRSSLHIKSYNVIALDHCFHSERKRHLPRSLLHNLPESARPAEAYGQERDDTYFQIPAARIFCVMWKCADYRHNECQGDCDELIIRR